MRNALHTLLPNRQRHSQARARLQVEPGGSAVRPIGPENRTSRCPQRLVTRHRTQPPNGNRNTRQTAGPMSTILKTVATTPALTPPSPEPPPLPASFHLQSPKKLQPILGVLGVTVWLKYKSKELVILAVVEICEVVGRCYYPLRRREKLFARALTLLRTAAAEHPNTVAFVAIHELKQWVDSLPSFLGRPYLRKN